MSTAAGLETRLETGLRCIDSLHVSVGSADDSSVFFPCYGWLGAATAVRELHAVVGGEEEYEVTVHTADSVGAATEGRVFVELLGSERSSGERELSQSRSHAVAFARGQADVFPVKGAHLGTLERVTVRHQPCAELDEWLLSHVVVSLVGESDASCFTSLDWFNRQPTMTSVRELSTSAPPQLVRLAVRTGFELGAGADANVLATLISSTGRAEEVTGCVLVITSTLVIDD